MNELEKKSLSKDIIELLQQYFKNKKEIKINKAKRNTIKRCDIHNYTSSYEDCYDARRIVCEPESFHICDFCKERDDLHNNIVKLASKNSGIFRSIKAKVSQLKDEVK